MSWHSPHTAGLLKEFQTKVFRQIVEPIYLILYYRAEGVETDPVLWMTHDMAVLVCVLLDSWDEKELTNDRAAFLFELMEFCLKPKEFDGNKKPTCSKSVQEHVALYKSHNTKHEWPDGRLSSSHIHATTVECLSEYDAIKKTKHCATWKNFLFKIIDKAFSLSPKLSPRETELKNSIKESYEQASVGGRTGNFKHPLGQEIGPGIQDFVQNTSTCWRVLQNQEGNEKLLSVDLRSRLRDDLLALACTILKSHQPLKQAELDFFCDIAPSFGVYGITPAQVTDLVRDFTGSPDVINELPTSMKLMDILQDAKLDPALNFDQHGRAIFLSLAKCLCLAERDEATKDDLALLSAIATTLFGPGAAEKLGLTATQPDMAHTARVRQASDDDDPMTVLASLVGLERVKSDVQQLVNFTKMQELRSAKGLSTTQPSRHMVFYGNPGTGKTTVARLISQLYKGLGILSKGHLVECDRSGLVGGYLGQTAIKATEVVKEALGGVLFIDEAYSLVQGGQDTYGPEAVDTLLKLMEDHRDNLVVIVAGYPEKMAQFINSNPGLRSRFTKVFSFDDYTPPQLLEIFRCLAKDAGYEVEDKALAFLKQLFELMYKSRDTSFGNGRDVRNVFEAATANQANRLAMLSESALTDEALVLITIDDIKDMIDPGRFKSSKPQTFGFRSLAEERA